MTRTATIGDTVRARNRVGIIRQIGADGEVRITGPIDPLDPDRPRGVSVWSVWVPFTDTTPTDEDVTVHGSTEFEITTEMLVVLTLDDIWPDHDAPPNPTADDRGRTGRTVKRSQARRENQ